MSTSDSPELGRDEIRAREAVRGLPRIEADPRFRERLKADFVAGRLGDATEGAPDARPAIRRRPSRWFRLAWLVPVVAIVAFLVLPWLNAGPGLRITRLAGSGTITIEGRSFDTSDRDALARALEPGARIEMPDGVELDLVADDTIVYELTAATATLPGVPGRWFGRAAHGRVDMGELTVMTGEGFRGERLSITTPEGIIEVTGTVISVFRDDSGTCVCVQEGTAKVGVDVADLQPVPAGQRKVMPAGGEAFITDIAPPHREHLRALEERYRSGIR